MNFAIVFLLFSCALTQFGSDAVFSAKQIQDISEASRPLLKDIPLPTKTNGKYFLTPLHFLGTIGRTVKIPAELSISNGRVQGLHTYVVNDNEVAFDNKNPERFNITLRMDKLTYQFDPYDLKTILSNKGYVEGEVYGVRMMIPVDTTNNHVTIVGPIDCDFKGQKLTFSKGKSDILDLVFNLSRGLLYGFSEDVMKDGYTQFWADSIIEAVNTVIPTVVG